MSTIIDVVILPGTGAHCHEDLSAMQGGATRERTGVVRELAEAVLVGLVLDDGQVAWGDCVGMVPRGRVRSWPTFRAVQGIVAGSLAVRDRGSGRSLKRQRSSPARISPGIRARRFKSTRSSCSRAFNSGPEESSASVFSRIDSLVASRISRTQLRSSL